MLQKNQAKDFILLVDLYVFGDKIDVPSFQNASIDAICQLCSTPIGNKTLWTVPQSHVLSHAFKHTPAPSPLRPLFEDFYAYGVVFDPKKHSFHDAVDRYPKEFVFALFRLHCMKVPQGPNNKPCPFENLDCVYHKHEGGLKCGDTESEPKRVKVFV